MYYPEERSETHFVRCLKCYKILKCSRYDTSSLLEHIRSDHPEIEIVEGMPGQPHNQNERSDATKSKNGQTKEGQANNGQPKDGQTKEQPPQKLSQLSIRTQKVGTVGDNTDGYNSPGLTEVSSKSHLVPILKVCHEIAASEGNQYDNEDNAKVVYTRRYATNLQERSQSPHRRGLYRTSIEKWRPAKGTIYCPKCGCNKRPLAKTRAERAATNSCGAACLLSCWPFCFLPCLFTNDSKEYLHCANCQNFLGLYDREANCVRPNREFCEQSEEKSNPQSECKEDDDCYTDGAISK